MPKIKHWLYGEKEYEVLVEKESECHKCFHKEVCDRKMSRRCSNYIFSTSEYDTYSCFSCLNRHAREDKKQPIPCFHCKNFKDEKKFERIEKLNNIQVTE